MSYNSLLMFTDDCMIFCEAVWSAARDVNAILENYRDVSGQLVNYHKPMVQFSKELKNYKSLVFPTFCGSYNKQYWNLS